MQKTACELVEGKWMKIQRFWLTPIKMALAIALGAACRVAKEEMFADHERIKYLSGDSFEFFF